MPGQERLGNQPPGPDPNQDPLQGPDMLADVTAGYDPVAEADAAMAAASAANPGGGPEAFQEDTPDGGSSLLGGLKTAMEATGQAARWIAPAAGTALKEETGFDAFQFTKEGQPDLDQDQQFVSGCLRWAGRRGAEVLAERLAVSR